MDFISISNTQNSDQLFSVPCAKTCTSQKYDENLSLALTLSNFADRRTDRQIHYITSLEDRNDKFTVR